MWSRSRARRAANATAQAPHSALGSVWVIRVVALTSDRSSFRSSTAAPRTALRIAGPLPAENTPLFFGEKPHQSLTIARAVALPTPAGKPSSHQRKRRANWRANSSGWPPDTIRAWTTMQVCSVSSDTMPRPKKKRCRFGSPNSRQARRFEIPS